LMLYSMPLDIAQLTRNYWSRTGAPPPQPPGGAQPPPGGAQPPGGEPNYTKIVRELASAIRVLKSKGNSATNNNRNEFKSKLSTYRAIPQLKRAAMIPKGLGNYENDGFPKKKGTMGIIGQIAGEKVAGVRESAKELIEGLDPLQVRRLREQIMNANRRKNTAKAAVLRTKLATVEKAAAEKVAANKAVANKAVANKAAAVKAAANKAAANKASAEKENKQKVEELRRTIRSALVVLNTKGGTANTNNRAAYVRAIQAYVNSGKKITASNRNLGVNRYSTTTGMSRTAQKPSSTTFNTSSAFISNMKKKLMVERDPKKRQTLLDVAIANLNKRLTMTARNGNALVLIGNYGGLSTNANYSGRIKRREEQRKTKKNETKKNEKKNNSFRGGGQQIIFGGGQPQAGGAAPGPIYMPAPAAPPIVLPRGNGATPAAPVYIPAPGGSAAGPSISVNPTIRVNVPQAAMQAAAQTLPPAERSALHNAGGYRRAASLINNAGGPETVTRALNALEKSNGNVQKAAETSGLSPHVFNNARKLGSPVIARRALVAVKKVSRKTTANVPQSVATRRALVAVKKVSRKRPVQKKKRVVSACACKMRPSNRIKTIVTQLSRKNLEKNFLTCLLP